MITTKTYWALIVLSLGVMLSACGSEDAGGGDGDGDNVSGDGDGAIGDGDGDGDGDSLDQGSLAENCAGMSPDDGAACEDPGLVCSDGNGSSCVCGGFEAGAGDGDDSFGRPGNGDNPPDRGSGEWECYRIGTVGTGGSENMGGGDGSGGENATGTGGQPLGGQGGAASN